jgi:hypothetical protein
MLNDTELNALMEWLFCGMGVTARYDHMHKNVIVYFPFGSKDFSKLMINSALKDLERYNIKPRIIQYKLILTAEQTLNLYCTLRVCGNI